MRNCTLTLLRGRRKSSMPCVGIMAVKKSKAKNLGSPRVRKKHPKVKLSVPEKRSKGWAALGFDLSTSSIAGCLLGYDATLDRLRGPHFLMRRWGKDDHYFSRIHMAAQ